MMTSEVNIVKCDFSNPDHLKAVGLLMNGYITDDMGGGKPLNPIQQLRLIDGLNNHPTAIVLLAGTETEAIGIIVAFRNFSTFTVKPMINIHDLYVVPSYRKYGIGRALMESIEEVANELKCSRITLEVRSDNSKAQSLYKSLGFEECDPSMHYWRKSLV